MTSWTPVKLVAEVTRTGQRRPLATPALKAVATSASVSSPPKYFSIRASSVSATDSMSFVFISSKSAGSAAPASEPKRETTPLKFASMPTGMTIGQHLLPKSSTSAAKVSSNFALSLSALLMTNMRGSSYLSRILTFWMAPTSTPLVASTTTIALSATAAFATTWPTKSV